MAHSALRDAGEGHPPTSAKALNVGMRAGMDDHTGNLADKIGINLQDSTQDFDPSKAKREELIDRKIMESRVEVDQGWLTKKVKDQKKIIYQRMKVHKELVERGHTERRSIVGDAVAAAGSRHPFPRLRGIVIHSAFENTMAMLIVSNCIVIGWQAELRNPEGATKAINTLLEHLFTFLFLVELVLRAIVFNWTFWFDGENHLDIFLVILSVLNSWILTPMDVKADFLRKATVLRILRLVRIAKSYRRRFKAMWQLLQGLRDSFETLVWTYVMMLCVLYFFAISATTIFGKMGAFDGDETAKQIVKENFDDVMLSMLTLFQIMTLDSWSSLVRPLMAVRVWSVFFFIVFITISVFLLMNLITSVIVTQAFEHGRADKTEQAADAQEQREKARQGLKSVFLEMDEDGGGTLSREEVAKAWKKPQVRQKFRTMDIGKKDLFVLWDALGKGEGDLDIDEFFSGMMKLKGEAKAKDILKLYREVRILESSIREITILSDYSKDRMNNIRMKLRTTFRELEATRRTLNKVKETARLASKSQPLCV